VIPCWNGERFVSDAIESALAQTYPNIEVIVIDDGSTDGTKDVLGSFKDRIRWESTPNRGGSAARTRGMEIANGDFIQFLDVDDLLHPRKIAAQLEVSRGDADAIVYCGRETHDVDRPEHKWLDSPTNEGDDIVFTTAKIVHTASPLYRRRQLEAVGGYRNELPCAQDYDLNLRLALRGYRFRKLDEILVTVRRRDDSVSSNSLKVLRQMRLLWRELLAELEKRGTLTQTRRATIAMCLAGASRAFARRGDTAEATRLLNEARQIDERGARAAYSALAWRLHGLIGPLATERLVVLKRRVIDNINRPL
jgi:glycosyltransferase involved in cell wall biosynthesis